MRKGLYLTFVLLLTGCSDCWFARVVELGNDFALVESDENYIEIFYSHNRKDACFNGRNSVVVVPAKVIAYDYDDYWIIAKSKEKYSSISSFWIIDKTYNYSRLGYPDELKEKTIGPLDSIQFNRYMLDYNIQLKLKDSKE